MSIFQLSFYLIARSSNGRTAPSGGVYLGSSPSLAASTFDIIFSMNPKLSLFSSSIIISIIVLFLSVIVSVDLYDPKPFWEGVFLTIFVINITFYLIGLLKAKVK
jgi:hypothetical protein